MSDQLKIIDHALRDAPLSTHTRRGLLERAGIGAAGLTLGGLVAPASGATAARGDGSIHEWGVFAATTEAFTVTLLPELLRRVSLHPEVPQAVVSVFDGAIRCRARSLALHQPILASQHRAVLDP